ncbi:hypothetical protein EJV46_01215 [Roseococcus sp. SYP-B2431]|uniref:AAA family ATPase n=1 Tax=Roseococcus sp. SYP-B2431 TaxID=2496640 RepID=UPI00103A6983|nr:ATP-binding protein [Roseococcus sp. SYP-B2431]TCI00716.1 hypothetical protein EJV46_01215 [Roseococcus sp. SYP-B2431]
MSLRIRRISVSGFRKFRQPFAIEGLTDGLNIVIEPNETGKSTLLEALRAAFFVRHGTRNQLAQSYAPHGDAVAPEIQVAFEADGAPWSLSKRFLKGASVEVIGPQGKAQGDEAEARLHILLGSVRDTSQRGDAASYGALGLLWVAQTEALSVSAPGQIVRDTVRSTLEAEVGSIMGGPAYKRVRDRVDEQYALYWTPTGQRRGRQTEASERLLAAEAAEREAADRLAAQERTFSDLDATRARLKLVQREIADETDAHARQVLVTSLEVARAAAQILATRRAELEAANGTVRALEDLQSRYASAVDAREAAERRLASTRDQRAALAGELGEARQRVATARQALDLARAARQEARTALTRGEDRRRAAERSAAIAAASKRHAALLDLERQQIDARALAARATPAKVIDELEANERAIAEARATVNAGATILALTGSTTGITIDGEPAAAGERTLIRETAVRLGDAELIVRPPLTLASAEARLTSALEKQRAALAELELRDIAAARARNDAARDAAADLRTIEARIAAITAADASIGLAAGAEALKLLVAGLAEEVANEAAVPDLTALQQVAEAAEALAARAEGTHGSALDALRRAESEDAPLAAAEAGAESDLGNAVAQLAAIESRADFLNLEQALVIARERAARAAVQLEEATRNASAHDVAAITRKIETIDARARTAGEMRTKLEMEVARLEAVIESEGGKGLADRSAHTREEAEAARAALQRTSEEAATLKLLRDTLEQARMETSSKFVGPVAKRAKRYIEQLLPGCDLSFSEDLGLESVIRGGIVEGCANLSRGTQEQLAVLTRIAFADLLLEQGRPVSLILDDPLVYSDDARLDLMVEILTEAATRMQVILLTCRDRAFRHIGGNRIEMRSSG